MLTRRFARGVFIEGDVFRRSIVAGRVEIGPDLSPEAVRQLRLRYRIAAAAADAYFAEGFSVVVEDVVAGAFLEEYVSLIESRPLHVVVVMPTLDTVAAREAARAQDGYRQFSLEKLYAGFAEGTPRLGMWIDSTTQSPTETVDAILAGRDRSLVAR